jgi:hypothetical protein
VIVVLILALFAAAAIVASGLDYGVLLALTALLPLWHGAAKRRRSR